MDHEDREEIPWSSLVAEMEAGVDRRWWIAGALAAVVIAAIVGFRFLGTGGGQPDIVAPASSIAVAPEVTSSTTSTPATITEEELRAGPDPDRERGARARAEWFVADYFTVDGSDETVASLRDAVTSDLAGTEWPHDAPDAEHTFVEWARTVRVVAEEDPTYVFDVAYRSIAMVDGSFVRRSVGTVRVTVTWEGAEPMIADLPQPVGDPWGPSV